MNLNPEQFPTYKFLFPVQTTQTTARTSIDGVQGDDEQSNWRAGATLTLPINIHNSIKLYGSTAV